MDDQDPRTICEDWDRLAKEYARRLFDELRYKPFDCELLDRFAAEVGPGDVCDMGCGPGHVARYLKQRGVSVLGLDLSPEMLEQARKLNPDISFREGNMMSLDIPKENSRGHYRFLCHRKYSGAFSSGGIRANGEGSETQWTLVARISR